MFSRERCLSPFAGQLRRCSVLYIRLRTFSFSIKSLELIHIFVLLYCKKKCYIGLIISSLQKLNAKMNELGLTFLYFVKSFAVRIEEAIYDKLKFSLKGPSGDSCVFYYSTFAFCCSYFNTRKGPV